ncbi:hypothetical protein COCSADRAFT_23479 [Bipolaris sorokiniana ND90Pr]|uniref:Uncharacterized protein n=1 Tax=Cochliobolus sativus (strain ND90Pr / ATCC 201652) TaxID=665912 RepID=M2SIM9_COCSN|nr:uncharacterized protein COCSADRAFT_23479 [Bipolaris sorokiniana ND90Pr]EMD67048.1 hypothetical protein COCSADRAFT_23479 [Bipolaris sorokiniana ND90Pr]
MALMSRVKSIDPAVASVNLRIVPVPLPVPLDVTGQLIGQLGSVHFLQATTFFSKRYEKFSRSLLQISQTSLNGHLLPIMDPDYNFENAEPEAIALCEGSEAVLRNSESTRRN